MRSLATQITGRTEFLSPLIWGGGDRYDVTTSRAYPLIRALRLDDTHADTFLLGAMSCHQSVYATNDINIVTGVTGNVRVSVSSADWDPVDGNLINPKFVDYYGYATFWRINKDSVSGKMRVSSSTCDALCDYTYSSGRLRIAVSSLCPFSGLLYRSAPGTDDIDCTLNVDTGVYAVDGAAKAVAASEECLRLLEQAGVLGRFSSSIYNEEKVATAVEGIIRLG